MKRIIVFAECFGYAYGGAEWSMFEFLKDRQRDGFMITVVFVENKAWFLPGIEKIEMPPDWEIIPIHLKFLGISLFPCLRYSLNRQKIISVFGRMDPTAILYAYGRYAPAAINAFKGGTVYFLRDEYGAGSSANYEFGFKRMRKMVHQLLDFPGYFTWRLDLKKCIKKSHVIVNAKYWVDLIKRLGCSSWELVYPQVDKKRLRADFARIDPIPSGEKGIVMVGDSSIKGSDIFRKIATYFPEYKFYLFAKQYKLKQIEGNIHCMPWESSAINVYKYAKLLLVPSRWREGYGRVAVEARVLNIPVLASRQGGLPEALDYDESCLIRDFENVSIWVDKIKRVLGEKI